MYLLWLKLIWRTDIFNFCKISYKKKRCKVLCKTCVLRARCRAHADTPTHTHQAVTLARSRSIAFMRLPWKYLTLVCCLYSKPSNSKSGSALEQKANFASLKKHNVMNEFLLFLNYTSNKRLKLYLAIYLDLEPTR